MTATSIEIEISNLQTEIKGLLKAYLSNRTTWSLNVYYKYNDLVA